MLNRDVFQTDPEQYRLANQGVAKISVPPAPDGMETLRSELSTFVCDGAYAHGLARILNAYLSAAGRGGSAPAVWISGFFGSGKSHLASMLAALWTNLTFEDGATAEGLVPHIPEEVAQPLKELRIAARRMGGVLAAGDTLGHGPSDPAEATLNIILRAVGLPTDLRARLVALERQHVPRRTTVWARRGDAPLAIALQHLARLAVTPVLPTQDADSLATAYAESGWQADWAALESLAAAPREADREAIAAAIGAVYAPWAEDGALALQNLAREGRLPWPKPTATTGTTVMFVDGLRFDLAHALVALLKQEGCAADLSWAWSGFPTVTATCKPLVSPVATALHGEAESEDLLPLTADCKAAAKPVLVKAMGEAGWSTSDTLLPEGKLWTECGRFDEEGHALGARLAERVHAGLRDVADRILQLARAGRAIRIVTDHGWLLLPGGLPQAPLDSGLVTPQGKRSRCARVKPTAPTSYLQLPWTWHPSVYVAVATGIRSFLAGQEYAHGGVSPQECVLPIITVSPLGGRRSVSIAKSQWAGLRLRVEVSGGGDLRADLRLGTETSGASLLEGVRVLDEAGKTSMLVSDEYEGKVACLVILADDGTVVAHQNLTVGGE